MSLTEEAYRERKWGPFPALRKALEDKRLPGEYFGLTTAHDDTFARLDRLIEISVLAREYESDIRKAAVSIGREEMCRDLRELEEGLKQASYFFKESIDRVRMIYATL